MKWLFTKYFLLYLVLQVVTSLSYLAIFLLSAAALLTLQVHFFGQYSVIV